MRAVILLSLLLAAGTASAESTISLKDLPAGGKTEDSIIRIGCADCPAPKPKTSGYDVPAVPKGQSRFELRTVKGEQMIYRADAMLGGSPVMFISKATPEWIAALKLKPTEDTADAKDGIDTTATTSALANTPLPPAVKKLLPVAADLAGFGTAPEKAAEPVLPKAAAPAKAPEATPLPVVAATPKPLDTNGFTLRN